MQLLPCTRAILHLLEKRFQSGEMIRAASTPVHLASSPRFCFFAETNKHVFLVESRDGAFLDPRVVVNAKNHPSSDVGLIRLDHD
jgi:hypothetical protein